MFVAGRPDADILAKRGR